MTAEDTEVSRNIHRETTKKLKTCTSKLRPLRDIANTLAYRTVLTRARQQVSGIVAGPQEAGSSLDQLRDWTCAQGACLDKLRLVEFSPGARGLVATEPIAVLYM